MSRGEEHRRRTKIHALLWVSLSPAEPAVSLVAGGSLSVVVRTTDSAAEEER
jgi:hypothetical protein